MSVVVPTYRRAEQLPHLVGLVLDHQTMGDVELIVVDDGSPDTTPTVLGSLEAQNGSGRLRIERMAANHGPARARNRGWRLARAPLVAFTDDDCRPRSGWLEGLSSGFHGGADVVVGRTVPDPDAWGAHGAFFHTVDVSELGGRFQACNIAYRRDLLETLGGFDERFTGTTLGEDMDLGLRARKAGADIAFAPDAVVVHEVISNDVLAWLRARRRRRTLPYLASKHPELREDLPLGVFSSLEHLRAVAGTVGTLLISLPRAGSLARLLGGLLAAQYAHFRIREKPIHGRRRHWPWAIPLMMAGETAESLIMARASLRQGFLLL